VYIAYIRCDNIFFRKIAIIVIAFDFIIVFKIELKKALGKYLLITCIVWYVHRYTLRQYLRYSGTLKGSSEN
jgi:hypothetical protein